MGNYTSCTNLPPKLKNPRSVRVILPGGEIRQFRQPVKAAELMLDHPAYFVTDSESLNIGRRFSPLSADDDLDLGNLYVMLPMRRVNSVVTAADAAVFVVAASSAPRRISANAAGSGENAAKVAPEATVEDVGENGWSRLRLEYKYRASRKPTLDTITEEPSFFIFLT